MAISPDSKPSLENHFLLNLNDGGKWKNPYLLNGIVPYVPQKEDQGFIANCTQVFYQCQKAETSPEVLFTHDAFIPMLCEIDPVALVNFSEVSKCCYLATRKNPLVWMVQFQKICPHVTPKEGPFSPMQLVAIIFQRIRAECMPYRALFERNKKWSLELKPKIEALKTMNFVWDCIAPRPSRFNQNPKPHPQCAIVADRMKFFTLNGNDYDGTDASIAENSLQGRLKHAIEVLVPAAFDNQERFEKAIQDAENAKNESPIWSVLNAILKSILN